MKVAITFELDLTGNPILNIASREQLQDKLKNMAHFLSTLEETFHERLEEAQNTVITERFDQIAKAALIEYYELQVAVAAQITDNYQISGYTDDGHQFSLIQKPKKEVSINGCVVQSF